jgi:hypothetical protein
MNEPGCDVGGKKEFDGVHRELRVRGMLALGISRAPASDFMA